MSSAIVWSFGALGVAFYFGVGVVQDPANAPHLDLAAPETNNTCGSVYEVAADDTLYEIALRAYGSGNYEAIMEANRVTLPDPRQISIGDRLVIPCLNGTQPMIGAAIKTGKAEQEVVRAASENAPIEFLTGSDFAPFVHRDLPDHGMAPELVRLAMAGGDHRQAIRITMAEEWSAHLDLLAAGAYQVGFPWYRPDCARAERLSQPMQRLCAEFDFSDPLAEIGVGYYVRAGNPLASAVGIDALSRSRICRPADHFTFDLEQEGLARASLVTPASAFECFELLLDGRVDVVTLARAVGEREMARLNLRGAVVEAEELATVQTLHAVARKADPASRARLDAINEGLARISQTGRMAEVAKRHFRAYGLQTH